MRSWKQDDWVWLNYLFIYHFPFLSIFSSFFPSIYLGNPSFPVFFYLSILLSFYHPSFILLLSFFFLSTFFPSFHPPFLPTIHPSLSFSLYSPYLTSFPPHVEPPFFLSSVLLVISIQSFFLSFHPPLLLYIHLFFYKLIFFFLPSCYPSSIFPFYLPLLLPIHLPFLPSFFLPSSPPSSHPSIHLPSLPLMWLSGTHITVWSIYLA